jgi:hypothetical protein
MFIRETGSTGSSSTGALVAAGSLQPQDCGRSREFSQRGSSRALVATAQGTGRRKYRLGSFEETGLLCRARSGLLHNWDDNRIESDTLLFGLINGLWILLSATGLRARQRKRARASDGIAR